MHRPCRIRGRVCCSFAMCALYWRQQYRKGAAAMRESATKKVLAESLKELMLRRDFADITVTDLCAAAEINRRTFYRHFTDKYQLVTWIYENGFQKAIGDDEPGLFDLFGRVCTYLYADRALRPRTHVHGAKLVPRLSLRPAASIFAEGFCRPFFQSADRGVHVR